MLEVPCRAVAAASSPRHAGSKQRQWGRRRQKLGAEQPSTKQTAPAEIPRGTRKALQTRFLLMVRLSANVLPGCHLVSAPLCLEHGLPFLTCSIQISQDSTGLPRPVASISDWHIRAYPTMAPARLRVAAAPSGRRVSVDVSVASAPYVAPLWLRLESRASFKETAYQWAAYAASGCQETP